MRQTKKPILETISIQCRTYILGLYGLYTRYDSNKDNNWCYECDSLKRIDLGLTLLKFKTIQQQSSTYPEGFSYRCTGMGVQILTALKRNIPFFILIFSITCYVSALQPELKFIFK